MRKDASLCQDYAGFDSFNLFYSLDLEGDKMTKQFCTTKQAHGLHVKGTPSTKPLTPWDEAKDDDDEPEQQSMASS